MRPFPCVSVLLFSLSCVGPEATDAVLCTDVVTRLCAAPRCSNVDAQLSPGDDCVNNITKKAGCDNQNFAFTTPTRARFLECRLPLVKGSEVRTAVPGCESVDEMFFNCPDAIDFLRGKK